MVLLNVATTAFTMSALLNAVAAGVVYINREEQLMKLWAAERACNAPELQEDSADLELFCKKEWDSIGCWPATPAGTVIDIPCPDYVNKFETEARASTRVCLENGTWEEFPEKNRSMLLTSRYHSCFAKQWAATGALEVPLVVQDHLPRVVLIYDVGYSISLTALVLSLSLMVSLKRLQCPRNTIHANLFASFILRAATTLVRSHLLADHNALSKDLVEIEGNLYSNPNASHWECKLLTMAAHYASGANFMWIFMEGLYLHMLIFATSFTDTSSVKGFVLGGWLSPLFYIIPYIFVRLYIDDNECWNNFTDRNLRWIVEGPMALTIIINFVLFLNIVRVLFTKLHANNTREDRSYRHKKLAKSTLVLIPLFGVHWIVFLSLDLHTDANAEVVRFYFDTALTSFQGLLVSLLFCLLNGEVKEELRKKWSNWAIGCKNLHCKVPSTVNNARRSSAMNSHTEATVLRDGRRNTPPVGADSYADDQRLRNEEASHLMSPELDDDPNNNVTEAT